MSKYKIKDVALKLFALKGYESTTMRDIAKEVGIKAPSIYSHYINKEAIFLELVDDLIKQFTWENIDLNELSKQDSFNLKDVLFDVFSGYYNYFTKNKYQLLFWQRIRFLPPSGLEEKYSTNVLLYDRPVVNVYIDLFGLAISKGQLSEKKMEILVLPYFAFVSGYIDSLLIVPTHLTDEQLRLAFEVFWKCIN